MSVFLRFPHSLISVFNYLRRIRVWGRHLAGEDIYQLGWMLGVLAYISIRFIVVCRGIGHLWPETLAALCVIDALLIGFFFVLLASNRLWLLMTMAAMKAACQTAHLRLVVFFNAAKVSVRQIIVLVFDKYRHYSSFPNRSVDPLLFLSANLPYKNFPLTCCLRN